MREAAEPVPLHLRNAPTKLMKQLDYGKGYQLRPRRARRRRRDGLPPALLQGRQYYTPKQRGFEKEVARRLERWEEIKQQRPHRPRDRRRRQ